MSQKDKLLAKIGDNVKSADRKEEFKKKYQSHFEPKPKAIRKFEKYTKDYSKKDLTDK